MRDLMGPVYQCLRSLKMAIDQADLTKVNRKLIDEAIGVYELAAEELLSRVNFVPEVDSAALPRFVADGVLALVQVAASGYTDEVKRPIVSQTRLLLDAWLSR